MAALFMVFILQTLFNLFAFGLWTGTSFANINCPLYSLISCHCCEAFTVLYGLKAHFYSEFSSLGYYFIVWGLAEPSGWYVAGNCPREFRSVHSCRGDTVGSCFFYQYILCPFLCVCIQHFLYCSQTNYCCIFFCSFLCTMYLTDPAVNVVLRVDPPSIYLYVFVLQLTEFIYNVALASSLL